MFPGAYNIGTRRSFLDDVAVLALAMNLLGNARRYKAAHAYSPTPPRSRRGVGRGMECSRIRKAKRMEPARIQRQYDHRNSFAKSMAALRQALEARG